jgi:hypothetical protein
MVRMVNGEDPDQDNRETAECGDRPQHHLRGRAPQGSFSSA